VAFRSASVQASLTEQVAHCCERIGKSPGRYGPGAAQRILSAAV